MELKSLSFLLILTIIQCVWPSLTAQAFRGPISDFIADHDVLTYLPVVSQHVRMKRSVDAMQADTAHPIIIRFRALGRRFNLHLLHDDSVLSKDVVLSVDGRQHPVDHLMPVRGYVGARGANSSLVYGVLNNGLFRGSIRPDTGQEGEFHVEPSIHYVNDSRATFHSIIYHDDHVDWKGGALKRVRRDVSPSVGCALANPEVAERMHLMGGSPRAARMRREATASRQRRSTESKCGDRSGLTCSLYLQSDTFLWNYIFKKVKNNKATAISEITSLFLQHVSAAKTIYSRTKFTTTDKSITYVGVDFRVQRILINTSSECEGAKEKSNPFCADNVDVINFLNLNAFIDHTKYCLAYVFTYRDFQRGTLGLAWVGDANNAGGICEKHRPIPEGGVLVEKSLNTGVVTLLNYGSTVSVRVSQSTFAHEMGHNFGATHDDDTDTFNKECVPGASSPDGNYIMFSSATGGDKKHNTEFSKCSRDKIARQLDLVINCNNGKRNCLMNADGAFCGNKLVEWKKTGGWEQCDCGYTNDAECKRDQCCYPGDIEDKAKACTLRPKLRDDTSKDVKCSPTAGECCDDTCQFRDATHRCDQGDECREPSNCNGTSAACPTADIKPNFNTTCSENTRTCKNGECIGSICAYVGMEECFVNYKDDDKGKMAVEMCYVACRNSTNSVCVSTHNLLSNKEQNKLYPRLSAMLREFKMEQGIQMKPGAPCDNYRGYCDVFSRCRSVDADGPLTRLKNLIFSPRTLTVIREWITKHWYYVIAIALGVILFMAVFVKCCAVHTPSSNPHQPKARNLSDTLRRGGRRRTGDSGRQQGVRIVQHGEVVELDNVGYGRAGGIELANHEPPPPYDQATPGHGHGRGRRQQGAGQRYQHQAPAPSGSGQGKGAHPRGKKKGKSGRG